MDDFAPNRRVGVIDEKETVWTYNDGRRMLTIRVGSIIELQDGSMYEVGYVEDGYVVTTQNRRYHLSMVEDVISPEEVSGLEVIIAESIAQTTKDSADPVNHPSHYTQGKFEVIEVIEEWTKHYSDGYTAYCVGNTMKYVSRAPHKHSSPLEDLKKARAYLDFAIAYEEAK